MTTTPRQDAQDLIHKLITDNIPTLHVHKTVSRASYPVSLKAKTTDLPLVLVCQPTDESRDYEGSFRVRCVYLVPVVVYIIDFDDESGGADTITSVLSSIEVALQQSHWPPVGSSRVVKVDLSRVALVVDKFPLFGYQVNAEVILNYNSRNP